MRLAPRAALRACRVAAGLCALCALSACMPLYVPLVPESPAAPAAVTLGDSVTLAATSRLDLAVGRPRLVLTVVATGPVSTEQRGGWLDVQWFGPSGSQAASQSVWVEPGQVGDELEFELPGDVVAGKGEWRAVVSMDGVLLRQFRVDVVADPEP